MSNFVKLGAVSFLNAKPLSLPLIDSPPPWIDLKLNTPSNLADQLRSGDLDVALIPSIEFFREKNYLMIPDISISSRGEVLSIQLFSNSPIEQCEIVALDRNSRTSRAMVKILLIEKYALKPKFISCDATIELNSMAENMAVLLIGDLALQKIGSTKYALDLGKEWNDKFGLPFVYAFWVARNGTPIDRLSEKLLEVKAIGKSQIDEISRSEAKKLGLSADFCRRYLTEHIFFELGKSEMAGLMTFRDLAVKHGILDR